jgi:hypothetical protein
MSGALFYAARIPVETLPSEPIPEPTPEPVEAIARPAFTLPDLEGTSRQLDEWDGKHRILNFWARGGR